jgi:hypothetical protein
MLRPKILLIGCIQNLTWRVASHIIPLDWSTRKNWWQSIHQILSLIGRSRKRLFVLLRVVITTAMSKSIVSTAFRFQIEFLIIGKGTHHLLPFLPVCPLTQIRYIPQTGDSSFDTFMNWISYFRKIIFLHNLSRNINTSDSAIFSAINFYNSYIFFSARRASL